MTLREQRSQWARRQAQANRVAAEKRLARAMDRVRKRSRMAAEARRRVYNAGRGLRGMGQSGGGSIAPLFVVAGLVGLTMMARR